MGDDVARAQQPRRERTDFAAFDIVVLFKILEAWNAFPLLIPRFERVHFHPTDLGGCELHPLAMGLHLISRVEADEDDTTQYHENTHDSEHWNECLTITVVLANIDVPLVASLLICPLT